MQNFKKNRNPYFCDFLEKTLVCGLYYTFLINERLGTTPFDVVDMFADPNDKWNVIKKLILDVVDEVAPLSNPRRFPSKKHAWFDQEMVYLALLRDKAHRLLKKASHEKRQHDAAVVERLLMSYRTARANFKRAFRRKHIECFRSSKDKWRYYQTHLKSKKDMPLATFSCISKDGVQLQTPHEISNAFNAWFSSILSNSSHSSQSCVDFVDKVSTKSKCRQGQL
jgi:hypothetical protein